MITKGRQIVRGGHTRRKTYFAFLPERVQFQARPLDRDEYEDLVIYMWLYMVKCAEVYNGFRWVPFQVYPAKWPTHGQGLREFAQRRAKELLSEDRT